MAMSFHLLKNLSPTIVMTDFIPKLVYVKGIKAKASEL